MVRSLLVGVGMGTGIQARVLRFRDAAGRVGAAIVAVVAVAVVVVRS